MPKMNKVDASFAFYQRLYEFYEHNRGKIRSRYRDLTKKFLAYNDRSENPDAFLRPPQFQALEIYIFIKEFLSNSQVYEMFDQWRKRKGPFSDRSYYTMNSRQSEGQITLFDDPTEKLTDTLFKQMKKYQESYPNYIYALTMGLGKTVLMATCIFYEFLLAKKYPKDKRYCHNALVFAPDKTVLQSLREIMTFDKTNVVPLEYAQVLDQNIKFHFLDESGMSLHTLDDSDFNIIISNTQKIIVKKKRKAAKPTDVLYTTGSLLSGLYGGDEDEDDVFDDASLMENQRFKKLCRLTQLGVYVDEAHHLFGADLEKQIRATSGQKTSLRDTINMLAKSTTIVGCYNYTGTPYVNHQLLPEVVYAYGLKESIWHGFLKEVDVLGYENVKDEGFLRDAIARFWRTYGGKTFEGLMPKMAIFASTIAEATDEVRPMVETILAELGIPVSTVLVNIGDDKVTKNEDIRNFNELDVPGSVGNQKQFLILVGKGREGWNCRSLFAVAMFRSPKSKVFVLQATMRCLRAITRERQTATVFLSKDNYDILNDELNKNFDMEIKDMNTGKEKTSRPYHVRVVPPPRTIKMKRIWQEYTLLEKGYQAPIDFGITGLDRSKYAATIYERRAISREMSTKEISADDLKSTMRYSAFSLAGEIARYLNISCILAARIIRESIDGEESILKAINQYNEVLDDIIIPTIFSTLFEIKGEVKSEDQELVLLREPKDSGYYVFTARPELVVERENAQFTPEEVAKSFHADTYCFDSKPERECFMQYIMDRRVRKIYFTGMFTSNQGDLSIRYYDPESMRVRQYYPDFFAEMADGTYQLIEVKGDNMIDDAVVKAKADAATIMAVESGVEYRMYRGSDIIKSNILDTPSLALF